MALGHAYHPEEFVCSQCGKILEEGGFFEEKGAVFCPPCYDVRYAPSCAKCKKTITGVSGAGGWVTSQEDEHHTQGSRFKNISTLITGYDGHWDCRLPVFTHLGFISWKMMKLGPQFLHSSISSSLYHKSESTSVPAGVSEFNVLLHLA